MPERTRPSRLVAFVAAGLAVLLFVVAGAKAWVCDDAYLTFRTADNILHGFGPRWNAAERVQAYTHPLWMWVVTVAAALTREFYWTSLVLGLGLSAAALVVLARHAVSSRVAVCGLLALWLASRAATDYMTSGLENPLAHLLLALWLAAYLVPAASARRRNGVFVWAGLAACNRLDVVWLLAPALVLEAAGAPRSGRLRAAARAALPLVVWEVFALFYYGAVVPNSALAKLATGIAPSDLARQGFAYLADSLRRDPVTLLATAAGAALPLVQRDRRAAALSAGIVLHLVWVVSVGGDFMSGRFLTPSFCVAAVLLVRAPWRPRAALAAAAAGVAAAGVALALDASRDRAGLSIAAQTLDSYGIADERRFYARMTGARFARRDRPWPDPATALMANDLRRDWLADPFVGTLIETGLLSPTDSLPADTAAEVAAGRWRPVVVRAAVGTLGFDVGPGIHVLDLYALGDPLRARLPAERRDPLLGRFLPRLAARPWRPGHFIRRIPEGYVATLVSGTNQLRDADLASYWDDLARVTRGPLWARDRFGAIWRLQRGAHDSRLQRARAREVHP